MFFSLSVSLCCCVFLELHEIICCRFFRAISIFYEFPCWLSFVCDMLCVWPRYSLEHPIRSHSLGGHRISDAIHSLHCDVCNQFVYAFFGFDFFVYILSFAQLVSCVWFSFSSFLKKFPFNLIINIQSLGNETSKLPKTY